MSDIDDELRAALHRAAANMVASAPVDVAGATAAIRARVAAGDPGYAPAAAPGWSEPWWTGSRWAGSGPWWHGIRGWLLALGAAIVVAAVVAVLVLRGGAAPTPGAPGSPDAPVAPGITSSSTDSGSSTNDIPGPAETALGMTSPSAPGDPSGSGAAGSAGSLSTTAAGTATSSPSMLVSATELAPVPATTPGDTSYPSSAVATSPSPQPATSHSSSAPSDPRPTASPSAGSPTSAGSTTSATATSGTSPTSAGSTTSTTATSASSPTSSSSAPDPDTTPPVIVEVLLTPEPSQTRAFVQVLATDNVGVSGVTAQWTAQAGDAVVEGSAYLVYVSGRWTAMLAMPKSWNGSLKVTVQAFDEAGNASQPYATGTS